MALLPENEEQWGSTDNPPSKLKHDLFKYIPFTEENIELFREDFRAFINKERSLFHKDDFFAEKDGLTFIETLVNMGPISSIAEISVRTRLLGLSLMRAIPSPTNKEADKAIFNYMKNLIKETMGRDVAKEYFDILKNIPENDEVAFEKIIINYMNEFPNAGVSLSLSVPLFALPIYLWEQTPTNKSNEDEKVSHQKLVMRFSQYFFDNIYEIHKNIHNVRSDVINLSTGYELLSIGTTSMPSLEDDDVFIAKYIFINAVSPFINNYLQENKAFTLHGKITASLETIAPSENNAIIKRKKI